MNARSPRSAYLLLASLIACASPDEGDAEPRAAAPSAQAPRAATPPVEPPDIRGIVTAVDTLSVRIEEDPTAQSGSAKAVVHLRSQTRLLYRDGRFATSADLVRGHRVSAWFAGPVMESYPVQTSASVIMIEPEDLAPTSDP